MTNNLNLTGQNRGAMSSGVIKSHHGQEPGPDHMRYHVTPTGMAATEEQKNRK